MYTTAAALVVATAAVLHQSTSLPKCVIEWKEEELYYRLGSVSSWNNFNYVCANEGACLDALGSPHLLGSGWSVESECRVDEEERLLTRLDRLGQRVDVLSTHIEQVIDGLQLLWKVRK
jgi:hypothetical protein